MSRGRFHLLSFAVIFYTLASFSQAQETRWKELDARAAELTQKGKYRDALSAAQEGLQVAESTFPAENANVASALSRLGDVYEKLGKFAEAEPLFKRCLAIREKVLGPEHPEVAQTLHDLAAVLFEESKYAEAEPLCQRALAIREKVLGPEHPDVANSLDDVAAMYSMKGKYDKAEELYRRGLAIREKVLGPDNAAVAESLGQLGAMLDRYEGKYSEAGLLLQRAITIDEKALGPEDPSLARDLLYLAPLYLDEGKFPDAEALYKRGLAILEKALGQEHPNVAGAIKSLAALYINEGKYEEAELLLKRVLAIDEKSRAPEDPVLANSNSGLGFLYESEGKYREAEPLFRRALATYEKAFGPDHPYVARGERDLAHLYELQGDYADAEPRYKRALTIYEKALGPEHPSVAATLNSVAALYIDEGKYIEASEPARRALAIYEKLRGREDLHSRALNNVATVYTAEGKYSEAEPLLQRALALQENLLGSDHPLLVKGLSALASLYYAEGKYGEAESPFDRSLQNVTKQFERYFVYMSERERLAFLDTVSNLFPVYFSYCYAGRERAPELTDKMYNVLLWEKGLVASSIASLQARLTTSGDHETLALFQKLAANRARLAAMLEMTPKNREEWRQTIEQLGTESNEMEKQLALRSADFVERNRLAQTKWQDVQKQLGAHDAAVEFVRFQFHDGKRFTGKAYYVALVVTPQTTAAPVLVLLGDAYNLEGKALHSYRQWVSRSGPLTAATLYRSFWEPLEITLQGSKRIYLSPDGILNDISFGIIPTPHGLLMDKYDLRVMASTRDLVRARTPPPVDFAVLIGNPKFDLTEAQQRSAEARLRPSDYVHTSTERPLIRSFDGAASRLSSLPGTDTELRQIRSLLKTHNWQVDVYAGENALAGTVKTLHGPRVLHLATHGFFLSDRTRERDSFFNDLPPGADEPMLHAGLYFSGANRTLAGALTAADVDDGILTAYEASGLNLQGTELVVLSACDSGLGRIKNGEGVFGLRRAFQEAGAESVLMSLWSVPDRETQELMVSFYKHWLAGEEKPAALRSAQIKLRETVKTRYGQDRPFYWGGFILVGR